MTCPACGSPLREHTTGKGAVFQTCSRWPKCKISGTPELLERLQTQPEPEIPLHSGSFIVKVAQLRIHQSRLKAAKTPEERESVRKQALEAMK